MTVLIESIIACVLFTVIVIIATRSRREAFVNDYPPVITENLRDMRMIAEKPTSGNATLSES